MRRNTFSRLVLGCVVISVSAAGLFAQPAQWAGYTEPGWAECRKGHYAKSIELLEEGLKAAGAFPADDPRVAMTQAYLAYATYKGGRPADSDKYAKKALAFYEKTPQPSAFTAKGINALALLRQSQRQYNVAENLYRQAQTVEEKLYGANHPGVAQLLANRATLYELQGRYEEAEPLLKQAILIFGADDRKERSNLAATLLQLGGAYRAWGRDKEAEASLVRAVEIRRKTPGKDDLPLAQALNSLGTLYFDLRKNSQAEPLLREALSYREKALKSLEPAQQLDLAVSQHNLAVLCMAEKKYPEAETLFQKALSIRKAAFPTADARTGATLHNLGMLYLTKKQYGPAEDVLKEAIKIKEQAEGSNHLDLASTAEALGTVYQGLGPKLFPQADQNFRRALAIREKALGPSSPSVAATQLVVANFYRDNKRFKEADPLYQKALATREKQAPDSAEVATVLDDYSAMLKLMGNAAKADELAARAKAIRAKASPTSSN